jgi:signal transduction histidine kinase/ligand-binding sensor domain-containing protein
MRRLFFAIFLSLFALTDVTAQGIPFFQNFNMKQYGGHKYNFDITVDKEGVVFVANFEGLLYYDNAVWRIVHTKGISRITSVYRDSKGKIWTGGYNYFGYVKVKDDNGELVLKEQDEHHEFKGEVQRIWESKGDIYFSLSNGNVYVARENTIYQATQAKEPAEDLSSPIPGISVSQKLDIGNGLTAVATNGDGLYIVKQGGNIIYHISEDNGLCSDNIYNIAYNGHGHLWGATDNGIFVMAVPTSYTHYTQEDGLRNEVLSIAMLNGVVYAGTLGGVYRQTAHTFEQISKMTHACYQLVNQNGSLLAATSNGVYRISPNGTASSLSTANTMAILPEDNGVYCGEMDGVYFYVPGKTPTKVCDAEKVTKIIKDKKGVIWLQNIYGRIWNNEKGSFNIQTENAEKEEMATLVMYNGQPTMITANTTEPFPYPLFSYTDQNGILWLTNNQGKGLYALQNGSKDNEWNKLVYPLTDYTFRALLRDGNKTWLGGTNGIYVIDTSVKDPTRDIKQKVFFRSVIINDDSLAWGGFNELPNNLVFKSDERLIKICYSADYPSLLMPTQYRYRINGGRWSGWDFDTFTEYNNQSYGTYVFEVQARDAFGNISETIKMVFEIEVPFYLKWYMLILYLLLCILLIYTIVRWRLNRLRKEKIRLENIVQKRTAEVVKQKDEIEEKSKSLEKALNDLGEAQHELVRQEKMATVGKLTQGLIDRILNPLNYINNFSKLSEGLVNDVTSNIEEEKEHMEPENYEDTIDVLGMLKGNLEKVSEHGANTTRTLKAMEEMLKDRSGGIVDMDLIALIRQNEEMLAKYFEKDISEYHIKTVFNYPDTTVHINGNAEQLSKTFMSLLGNAVYATVKKAQRTQYAPEIDFTITPKDDTVEILIKDNGIGIEDTIINKVFDPFFTTKTTGEASGVGLYLSREIIQNYGGDISVTSQKNEYTEFSIILPINNGGYGETN